MEVWYGIFKFAKFVQYLERNLQLFNVNRSWARVSAVGRDLIESKCSLPCSIVSQIIAMMRFPEIKRSLFMPLQLVRSEGDH